MEPQLFEIARRQFDTPEFRGITFIESEAKSIINRVPGNSLPFNWTINPYRGCSHSCTYCQVGDTPILMADGRTKALGNIEVGQPGSGMFVLEEGTVVVELPDGRSWEYGPGEFFGELALLTDHPRHGRVRAKTAVKCLAISRRDFQELLREEPEIAVAMLPKLAARIDAPH